MPKVVNSNSHMSQIPTNLYWESSEESHVIKTIRLKVHAYQQLSRTFWQGMRVGSLELILGQIQVLILYWI